MRDHTVRPGECLASIAAANGFFWESLWQHDKNAALRKHRIHAHVLYAGDVVHIPNLRVKKEACDTGRRHTFRRKGVPEQLRLRFSISGEPRTEVPYRLVIDGVFTEGRTDAEGELTHFLPPDAREGLLILLPEDAPEEYYELALRGVDPATEATGVQQRLGNLGYYAGPVTGILDEATTTALRAFQASQDLEVSGTLDPATCDALVAAHGC